MRVLIATDTYPPTINGAARFTERLAKGLAGRGHDVHVVYPSPSGKTETVRAEGVTFHRRYSVAYPFYDKFRLSPPLSIPSGRLVDAIAPDVIHLQDHFWLCSAIAGSARYRNLPVIATNHLMPENFFDHVPVPAWMRGIGSKWVWTELERVFRSVSQVTSPTPKAVELLMRATKFSDAIAVSNGVDTAPYAAAAAAAKVSPGCYSPNPIVLFVGRLDQEKRVNELIAAFAGLPEALNATLEIVGDGSLRGELQRQAQRLGVADRVKFLGFVGDAELLAAYARADLFCMPGVAELQSLVTLESMSAGKPVIAANAMALPHLVHTGENGFLFTPGNVDELRGRLVTLLSDADLRERMGSASKEIVAAHSMASTLEIFEGLYAKAIAEKGPAAR